MDAGTWREDIGRPCVRFAEPNGDKHTSQTLDESGRNIDKRLSFHTGRHTFAAMMLTLGADLYTTSKLLGHADVKMTQVYAKIINQKKDDAVNLVNGLFG